jgi:hypothetical protein
MTAKDFNDGLRQLCSAAMRQGLDAGQIIGQLEIAKLNVDHFLRAEAEKRAVEPVQTLPRGLVRFPNGEAS